MWSNLAYFEGPGANDSCKHMLQTYAHFLTSQDRSELDLELGLRC